MDAGEHRLDRLLALADPLLVLFSHQTIVLPVFENLVGTIIDHFASQLNCRVNLPYQVVHYAESHLLSEFMQFGVNILHDSITLSAVVVLGPQQQSQHVLDLAVEVFPHLALPLVESLQKHSDGGVVGLLLGLVADASIGTHWHSFDLGKADLV